MKLVVPPTSFATGMDVEEQSFTWTIANFPVVRMGKSMINSQKIDFTAGETSGYLSQWNVHLEESNKKDDKRWIGIWLQFKSPTQTAATFTSSHSKVRFTIKNEEGGIIKDKVTRPKHIATDFADGSSFGFREFIDADDDNFCPEESLVIQITFYLYTPPEPKITGSLQVIMDKFGPTFLNNFHKDLTGLLETPDPCSDIKIVSNDGKEFTKQRGILAVRSEVFAAMLRSDMIEANSGVIELPDISSKTLEILLNFLCTGELDPDWNQVEVVVELTNAAAKYQLSDLLQFLDMTLGKVCKPENVLPLLTLAHQLSLKTAKEELSKYIHIHSISSEDCCKMLKGMAFPGLDGSVESLPKRKFRVWTLLSRLFKVRSPK